MFRYATGDEVRRGDIVQTGNAERGVVKRVIEPGSQDAGHFHAPEGGILIEEDWNGVPNLVLETPPDGEEWEDLVLIQRGMKPGRR